MSHTTEVNLDETKGIYIVFKLLEKLVIAVSFG